MSLYPKYPDVHVQLTGQDGNVFGILYRTKKALRRAGVQEELIQQYMDEATSGDYDKALQTTMKWVDVT